MMPIGIQAIGAIGARPRTIGSTAADAVRDIETRMPVATAATKPMNEARHHAERARHDRHRDRHAFLAEADAEVALDRVTR